MMHSRRPNMAQHRARPAPAQQPENEEEKIEYIEFINRLMHRMRLDSVKRMLDAALKEIG